MELGVTTPTTVHAGVADTPGPTGPVKSVEVSTLVPPCNHITETFVTGPHRGRCTKACLPSKSLLYSIANIEAAVH